MLRVSGRAVSGQALDNRRYGIELTPEHIHRLLVSRSSDLDLETVAIVAADGTHKRKDNTTQHTTECSQ